MPIDYISEVLKLASVEQPTEQPTPADWNALELELNLTFPSDFKSLVSALGTGKFGDGLTLSNPCASPNCGLISKAVLIDYRDLLADMAKEAHISLYPDISGLVLIGSIDRQNLLLRPDKSRTLGELVWWDIDQDSTKDLSMSITQFIHDLYRGKIDGEWAEMLQRYVWRQGSVPFFSVWRGPTPGPSGYLPGFLRENEE